MQINQYPNEAVSLVGTDLFDIDKDMGAGVWLSHKLKFSTLITEIGANSTFGENIGNTNLVLTNNRVLDCATNLFWWKNVSTFIAESGSSPSLGNASYNFKGSGSTSADELFRVKNGAGTSVVRVFGDGFADFSGNVSGSNGLINSNNPTGYGITATGANYGILGYSNNSQIGVGGSGDIGIQGVGFTKGVHGVTTSNGYGVYGEGGTGVAVYGESSGTSLATGWLKNTGGGVALLTYGRVQLSNLPTSATGLSIGELWNDSGTIKIV